MRVSLILIVCLSFLFACKNDNKKDEQIEELNRKIDSLTNKQKEANQLKEKEAAEAKAKEIQEKKDLIIKQIKMGEGLETTNNNDCSSITLENALSGIVFQVVTVEITVYLNNGKVYNINTFTFTNLKPGDVRTRNIPNTDNRRKTCIARVTEIQSNWLTNGKLITL